MSFTVVKFFTTVKAFEQRQVPSVTTAIVDLKLTNAAVQLY